MLRAVFFVRNNGTFKRDLQYRYYTADTIVSLAVTITNRIDKDWDWSGLQGQTVIIVLANPGSGRPTPGSE